MTLNDLQQDGPPIRVRDVARLAGISRQKVYADADRGEVVVKPCKCGSRWMGKIERSEARRYINHLQRSH